MQHGVSTRGLREAAVDAVLDELRDVRAVHWDLRPLEALRVVRVLDIGVRERAGGASARRRARIKEAGGGRGRKHARVVPDRKVPHAARARGPLVVVREPARVEDLDHGRHGRDGHHDEVREPVAVHAEQDLRFDGRADGRTARQPKASRREKMAPCDTHRRPGHDGHLLLARHLLRLDDVQLPPAPPAHLPERADEPLVVLRDQPPAHALAADVRHDDLRGGESVRLARGRAQAEVEHGGVDAREAQDRAADGLPPVRVEVARAAGGRG